MKMPFVALAVALIATAPAAEAQEPTKAGPGGGRVLALGRGNAEFLVQPDRTAVVTFLDDTSKPRDPSGEVVTAVAETPQGKKKIAFAPNGTVFTSTEPLPAGEGYMIVLQIRETPATKPKNFRIVLNLSNCRECGLAEYACTCGH